MKKISEENHFRRWIDENTTYLVLNGRDLKRVATCVVCALILSCGASDGGTGGGVGPIETGGNPKPSEPPAPSKPPATNKPPMPSQSPSPTATQIPNQTPSPGSSPSPMSTPDPGNPPNGPSTAVKKTFGVRLKNIVVRSRSDGKAVVVDVSSIKNEGLVYEK